MIGFSLSLANRSASAIVIGLCLFVCNLASSANAAAPAIKPSALVAETKDEIVIGAVISRTGRKAALAIHQIRGYDIAVERINNAGGVLINNRRHNLRIEYRDDQSKRRIAEDVATELLNNNIELMLGGFSSGLVDAVAQVTEPAGIPMVQGGGALLSLYEKSRKQLFGVVSTIEKYLTSILSLAVSNAEQLGKRPEDLKLAISVVDGQAGRESRQPVIDMAAKLGIDIVIDHFLKDPIGIDQANELFDLVAIEKPDILLVFGYDIGAKLSVGELAKRKIALPVFGTTHCDGAEIEKLGGAADYVFCVSQWDAYANYPDPWFGSSVDFLVEFELTYGYLPPYQAAQGAATVLTLADALERSNSLDPKDVREALSQTNLNSMFGPIRFDPSGKNIAKPMVVLQIHNGRYKVVWPSDVAWSRAVIPAPRWEIR